MNKFIYFLFISVSLASCTKEKEEVEIISNYMELTIETPNSEVLWEANDFENRLFDVNNKTTMEIIARSAEGSSLRFVLCDYRRQYGAEQIGVGDYVENSLESYYEDTEGNRTNLLNGGVTVTQIDSEEQRITGNISLSDSTKTFIIKGNFVNAEYDIQ